MWSICLREGNVSPENLAKGPESAIGQVRQVSVRTTPTDEGWERAEKELRESQETGERELK